MRLPFSLREIAGSIDITVDTSREPRDLGAPPDAVGLAHCQATITYTGKGYTSLLGWIQLVRSTDNASQGQRFEMDPLTLVGEVPHPFGFYGIKPTLFDAPSRSSRANLDWLAHSFLCHIADYDQRIVHAICGFSWGFSIDAGATAVIPARRLESADWNQHLDLLHTEHPAWQFADGLRT